MQDHSYEVGIARRLYLKTPNKIIFDDDMTDDEFERAWKAAEETQEYKFCKAIAAELVLILEASLRSSTDKCDSLAAIMGLKRA